LTVQIQEVTEDTKAPSSNFAAERINNVDILENLSDSDADVGVDAVKSDVAAGPRQPARSPDRDYVDETLRLRADDQ
jgi:hypothetical protein